MKRRSVQLIILLAVAGWQLPGLGAASAGLDLLLKNSPFQPPAPPVTPGPVSETTTLELHGVLLEKGEFLFSIYDLSARSSHWVALKEPGLPYVVERYNSATGQAIISHRGKVYRLSLRTVKAAVTNLARVNPWQPMLRDEGPWSIAAAAATWRSDLEQDYLDKLPPPGGDQ